MLRAWHFFTFCHSKKDGPGSFSAEGSLPPIGALPAESPFPRSGEKDLSVFSPLERGAARRVPVWRRRQELS